MEEPAFTDNCGRRFIDMPFWSLCIITAAAVGRLRV